MEEPTTINDHPSPAPSGRLPGEDTTLWPVLVFMAALAWRALNSLYGDTYYDGFAYIMTARNILSGQLAMPYICQGITNHYQPLYPLLIAALNFITRDLFASARLVNILAGSLLVFPVFGFTRDVFGRRAAIYAAALLVINPELVRSSSNAYSEPVYVLAGLTGIWLAWRALDRDSWRWLIAGTAMFVLAALARAQGVSAFIAAMLGFGAAGLLRRRGGRRKTLAMALAASALFLIVAAASFHYLERRQDKAEVGGKVGQELYKKPRMYRDPQWLTWEHKLAPSGEKLYWVDMASQHGPWWPVLEKPAVYFRLVLRDLMVFSVTLFSGPFLPPLLLLPIAALMLLDLARRDFQRGLVLYFAVILAGTVLSLALIASTVERYLQLAIPLFLVLAGAGMAAAEPLIVGKLGELKAPRFAVNAVPWLFILGALGFYNQPALSSFTRPPVRDQIYRQAAEWARPFLDPARKEIIMAVRPGVPAYTGDYFYLLPLDGPERVAHYARAQNADFILIDEWYLKKLSAPQRDEWLNGELAPWGLARLGSIGLVGANERFNRMMLFRVEKSAPAPAPVSGKS